MERGVDEPRTHDGVHGHAHKHAHKHEKKTTVGGMHGVGALSELAKDMVKGGKFC